MSRSCEGLKPYAVTPTNSRGRDHKESFPASIDPIAIDRERILHSTAFRRLEYKTQVFVSSEHDHFRTRLTHTLEVASIARRLCVALQVNGAVGELIALTHDVGHAPFGHSGETTLATLMKEHGGFEHNAQALRVIEFLEHPYPAFRGLNMLYEVRESLAKHCTIYDRPGTGLHPLADGSQAPIEGQIANLADRIAYDCHDLEDALGAELVNEQEIATVDLWSEAAEPWRKKYTDLPLAAVRRPILDAIEALMLNDAARESRRRIGAAKVSTLDGVRAARKPLVSFTASMEARLAELERFMFQRVYRHPRLVRMDSKGRRFIERLFEAYVKEPTLLPPRFQKRIDDQGRHRVVCDYLAGMTDRFCHQEYAKLFDPFEKV